MGIRVQILDGEAEARFDPARPAWVQRVEGRERVRIHLPGEAPQGFVHRFELAREPTGGAAVSDALALEDADFSSAWDAPRDAARRAIDPELRALDHATARERFLAMFAERGVLAVQDAALFLAEWLRAHPSESGRVLDDLASGALDDVARSAAILALELAGTDESRDVLAAALTDARLSELDRARAASALADHGVPTRRAADLLLTQARESSSRMVANVSLLGVGTMAKRTAADDPLRAELRDALHAELDRAATPAAEVVVIDAIGNSSDDAFAPALERRLGADRPDVRAHAAEALGRLSPEVARPRLLARLEAERSPRVSTAILRSLGRAHAEGSDLTEAELSLAARILAASSSVEERAAVIEWVGRASHQRAAREVLAAHFAREPNVRLKQRIGAFVGAAELRELAR